MTINSINNHFGATPGGFTMPTVDGTIGQVLVTNGAGIVAWGAGSAGGVVTGTFIPTLFGQTTGGVTTYTAQNGYYTQIGNVVTVWGDISGTGATGTGSVLLGGLPFTIQNQTNYNPAGVVLFTGTGWSWGAGLTSLSLQGQVNTTTASIEVSGSSSSVNPLQMANSPFQVQYFLSYLTNNVVGGISAPTTGTFVPTLSFGGASVGITYSAQQGEYTQIGNVIYFSANVTLTNKGSSIGAAGIVLTGLPNAANNGFNNAVATVALNLTLDAGRTYVVSASTTGTNVIEMQQWGSGLAAGTQNLTNTNFANNTEVTVTGFYFTT